MAGAEIWLPREYGDFAQEPRGVSAADGGFIVEGVSPGVHELRAQQGLVRSAARVADVTDGDATGVDLVVPGPLAVRGRVLSPDGRPVPGASVVAWNIETPDGKGSVVVSTYARLDGSFRMDNLRRGPVAVWADGDGLGFRLLPRIEIDAAETPDLTVQLEPGASVTGSVAFADGSPAPGVLVKLFQRGARIHDIDRVTRSDTQGRFNLAGLAPGQAYVLASAADGHEEPWGQPERPDLRLLTIGDGSPVPTTLVVRTSMGQ